MYRVGLALFVLLLGLAAAFAGGVVLASLRDEPEQEAPTVSVPAELTTLVDTIRLAGAVASSAPRSVFAPGAGVVTAVAVAPGDELGSGEAVMELGNQPVVVNPLPFLPSMRLEAGVTHDEVEWLETFLAETVDYAGSVDRFYTSSTTAAVREWQTSLGMTETGIIDPALFLAVPEGAPVVETVDMEYGATLAGGEVIATAIGDDRWAELLATNRAAAAITEGAEVVLTTGGDEVTVAGSASHVGESVMQEGTGVLGIEVMVPVPGSWPVGADVTAEVIVAQAEDVVAVPASALLEAPDGSGETSLLVETGKLGEVTRRRVVVGIAAGGMVEVRQGLDEGTVVVIGVDDAG